MLKAFAFVVMVMAACGSEPKPVVAPPPAQPPVAVQPQPDPWATKPAKDLEPNGYPPDPNGIYAPPPPPPPSHADIQLRPRDPGAPPPPPPPGSPTNVAPTLLERYRLAGDKIIVPDDTTKLAIQRKGSDRVIGSFKLCLDVDGAVSEVKLLKSSGFRDYDTKLGSTIRNTWRYSPYIINGDPVPVCTAVTFIYSQNVPSEQPSPPPP